MPGADGFNKLRPILYVCILVLAGLSFLWLLSITDRVPVAKGYLNDAVSELSIASDQLGSQLANLSIAVKAATRSKAGDKSVFIQYIDKLIPAVDNVVGKCSQDAKLLTDLQDEERASILLIHDQGVLRFQMATAASQPAPPSAQQLQAKGQQKSEKLTYVKSPPGDSWCAITQAEVLPSIFRALPETFDDVLIASGDGTVQYQSAGIGPRVVNLDGLLSRPSSQAQSDDGLRSLFTGLLSTATQSGPPSNMIDWLRTSIQEAARKKVRDETSFSNVVGVQLAGEEYFAIIQPVSLTRVNVFPASPAIANPQDLVLVGLIRSRALSDKASVWPIGVIAWLGLAMVQAYAIVFIISCVPGKSRFQRVRRMDLALMAFCVLACCAGLTLATTHIYFNLLEIRKESASSLEALANRMADNVEEELCNLYQLLDGMSHSVEFQDALATHFNGGKDQGHVLIPNLLRGMGGTVGHVSYSYPFFDYAFWSCYQGEQIAKWSIHEFTTPPTPMRRYPWFVDAREGRLYELRTRSVERGRLLEDDESRAVAVEPPSSPNTGEFLTILMKNIATPDLPL